MRAPLKEQWFLFDPGFHREKIMSVSAQELVLVFVVGLVCVILARKMPHKWLMGVPLLFLVLSAATPADPISTLIAAVPCSTIYVAAFLIYEQKLRRVA